MNDATVGAELDRLFRPRSIAILGASEDFVKISGRRSARSPKSLQNGFLRSRGRSSPSGSPG